MGNGKGFARAVGAGWIGAWSIGATFVAIYWFLACGEPYGDGPGMVLRVCAGEIWASGNHVLYLPLLWLWTELWQSAGLDEGAFAGLELRAPR